MVDFAEVSIYDLARITEFVHYIKPGLKDWIVTGVEKFRPLDMSIVFHLTKVPSKVPKGSPIEKELLILSGEFIYEHQFWKRNDNDEDRV